MKNWKYLYLSILLEYSMCVYITKGCGPILRQLLFFVFFCWVWILFVCNVPSYCWILFLGFLGPRSGCWSILSVQDRAPWEAYKPSALGPQVEKLTTSGSCTPLPNPNPNPNLKPIPGGVLGTQSIPSSFLASKFRSSVQLIYTSNEPAAPPPEPTGLCRPHASTDLPPSCALAQDLVLKLL